MPVATIKIQSLEEAARGENRIFPEGIQPSDCTEVPMNIAILEKGTVGGQTTLMFAVETSPGKYSFAQMTANQMEMLIGAFRGAVQKFGK